MTHPINDQASQARSQRCLGLGRAALAIALFAVAGGVAAPGLAQVAPTSAGQAVILSDVYAVRGVAVDESAESEAQAKSIAVESGVRTAFQAALERVTLRADWPRLPVVDEFRLNTAIRDVSFQNERFGGGRYLAELTVRFNPDVMRGLLSQAGIPYAETVGLPLVVLPVLQSGAGPQLWDEGNQWLQGWLARDARPALLPLVTPLNDLSDIAAISAQQALAGSPEALARIAERYQAQGVVVAVARPGIDANGGARIDVSSNAIGPGLPGVTEVDSFAFPPTTTLPEAYAAAADSAAAAVVERWKQANLIRPGQTPSRITLSSSIRSLTEWLTLKRELEQVAGVSQVRLSELSIGRAVADVDFVGDAPQLSLALSQRRLALEEDGTGGWTVRRSR